MFVERDRGARGRDGGVLGARRRAAVHAKRAAREPAAIDATCPLVTKVHRRGKEVRRRGLHDRAHRPCRARGGGGHDGRGARPIVLNRERAGRRRARGQRPNRVAYISQTTLSVDETSAIIDALRERFPAIIGPRTDDICYATTNRQAAVKQLARQCELVLVIGSRNRQLQPAGRGRARAWRRLTPDRRRRPGARRVVDRQAGGRDHVRRKCSRGARRAFDRALPGARHQRCPGTRGRPRGCAVDASQGDPPGGGGRRVAVFCRLLSLVSERSSATRSSWLS